MIKSFLLIISLFAGIISFSQDFITSNYDWKSADSTIACPDSLKSESEVNLLKKRIVEYGHVDDVFIERHLFHRIAYLGSDEAIEQNNRIYLPISNDETLEISKARAINPDGAVIELSDTDINQSEDEDGNLTYYYAFKGLVIGSLIEYFYIQVTPAQYSGNRILIQSDIIQLNFSFEIISPWNLIFAYKGFNGFGEMQSDTTDENLNHLVKHFDYIPKYESEDLSFYRVNATQVVYKLAENTYSNTKDIISYGNMADVIINNYTTGEKADLKIVSKLIKESGAKDQESIELKIRAFEVYIKKTFAIIDTYADELVDISFIQKNKITNARGFTKLMSLACNEMGIKYEIVMTSNRSDLLFDPHFEAYNYLDDYLIYFPEVEKFIDPSNSFGVIGIISPYLQDNYGVFFQRVTLGDFVSGVSQIKFLKGAKAADSHHDMIIDVKMSDDFANLDVDLQTISTGQFAAAVQPYYDLLDPETIESANKEQVTWISENMEVISVETVNDGYEQLGLNPFIINASFTTSDFTSKARDKYLLKIGLLIGPQAEMYQETTRKLPVDSDFRKFYHREINFSMPEGYILTNLESINLNVEATDKDGVYASFISSYSLENNILHIVCDEYYERVHYEVEEYEAYRAVINSAADFNKIVLYLEKE